MTDNNKPFFTYITIQHSPPTLINIIIIIRTTLNHPPCRTISNRPNPQGPLKNDPTPEPLGKH